MTDNKSAPFDLLQIFRLLKKEWKFIAIFTVLSLLLAFLFLLFAKPRYEARTTFIIRHPQMIDRNQMFRQDFYQNKNFFAEEEIIDEIVAMTKSPKLVKQIVDTFNLVNVYGDKAWDEVVKNMKVRRNDTREVDVFYQSIDSGRSVDIANFTRDYLESEFTSYFTGWNETTIQGLKNKMAEMDSTLNIINDSISRIRNEYGLYQQLLPSRGNAAQSVGSVNASNSKALEHLADLTKVKDKMAEDKANYQSLANEYSLGLKKENLNMFYLLQEAKRDEVKQLPNKRLVLASVLIASLIFSSILVVARDAFNRI